MRVLLVNPNRYKSPPVPPIGLEYLAASLEGNGHSVEILDLCFSESLCDDIDYSVASFRPDVAGVTVRNVDTVLYQTNEFFLDEIREVVNYLKVGHSLKTIVGGAGVSSNPSGVVEYLDADCAVVGPAETTIHDVLADIQTSGPAKVYRRKYGQTISCGRRPLTIDYEKYCRSGGVIGFETHKGCNSSCVYCLEANSRVSFKHAAEVLEEIRSFVDIGYNNFHLCDSEFNESLEYSIDFCSALKKSGLDIRWAVYMKPANFNKRLFKLLKDSGVYLITLTVDSWKKCPLYWTDYEKFVFGAKSVGLKVAVDFLTGFPYESKDHLLEYFDTLRRPLPDSIGVNTYLRLYSTLQITDIILRDNNLKSSLLGGTEDQTFLRPVFYNQFNTDILKSLIEGDPTFRVEGVERGVNYGRVKT
jgi:hypothetical protein